MTRVYTKPHNTATSTLPIRTQTHTNMSSSTSATVATPSPIPVRVRDTNVDATDHSREKQETPAQQPADEKSSESSVPVQLSPQNDDHSRDDNTSRSSPNDSTKLPSLASKARVRIHFEDLTSPAVAKFLAVMPVSTLLQTAISNVQKHLFTPPTKHHSVSDTLPAAPQTTANPTATVFQTNTMSTLRPPPPQKPIHPPQHWKPQEVRSITLVIGSMDGVAYTTGTDLDPAHKEIHLSMQYVDHIMKSTAEKADSDENFKFELMGVVTHEMVHVFQHNARGSCPGGLIEGMADYVRLKSGLGAKHWNPWPAEKKTRGEKWDEGYQKTAWFLDWVERYVEKGAIGKLNYEMRDKSWGDGDVWKDVMGHSVKDLWERYESEWEDMNKKHEQDEEVDKKKDSSCQEGVWL